MGWKEKRFFFTSLFPVFQLDLRNECLGPWHFALDCAMFLPLLLPVPLLHIEKRRIYLFCLFVIIIRISCFTLPLFPFVSRVGNSDGDLTHFHRIIHIPI